VRVRGLEQAEQHLGALQRLVAPRAGAWVGTRVCGSRSTRSQTSHPVRVRGLELRCTSWTAPIVQSHPVRVRGLEPPVVTPVTRGAMSHPVRVRGLERAERHTVAKPAASHPVRVRGLELECSDVFKSKLESHPVRVRGLEQPYERPEHPSSSSRTPCGCVGWNPDEAQSRQACRQVAPRAGAWVGTTLTPPQLTLLSSHPVRVRGLERQSLNPALFLCLSHPVRVRGLEHVSRSLFGNTQMSHPVRVRGLEQHHLG